MEEIKLLFAAKWENETAAVKQNINSLFEMLIDWGLTIIIIILGVLLLFVK